MFVSLYHTEQLFSPTAVSLKKVTAKVWSLQVFTFVFDVRYVSLNSYKQSKTKTKQTKDAVVLVVYE